MSYWTMIAEQVARLRALNTSGGILSTAAPAPTNIITATRQVVGAVAPRLAPTPLDPFQSAPVPAPSSAVTVAQSQTAPQNVSPGTVGYSALSNTNGTAATREAVSEVPLSEMQQAENRAKVIKLVAAAAAIYFGLQWYEGKRR